MRLHASRAPDPASVPLPRWTGRFRGAGASPGFSPLAVGTFELFFRPWMRRRIRAVRLAGLPGGLPADHPVLLVSNHVSWWDGFVLREVQRALRPGAPLYSVMLERELERLPAFRWLGAVGIDPARPTSVARALHELERRRHARSDMVVAFFPQGRIWPSFRRPLGFRRGIELFADRLAPLVALPVGIHLEPLETSAPTVFVLAGDPLTVGEGGVAAEHLEGAVAGLLDRILDAVARHGEDIGQAWPGAFGPSTAGR